MSNTIFDEFTNQYSLSKTLRFELRIPEEFPWTKTMLERENVFENDKIRREKYENVKPWIDRLHREFIEESLSDFAFQDLSGYVEALKNWQQNKKDKDCITALKKQETALRGEVKQKFDETGKEWMRKYKDLDIKKANCQMLFEAEIFRVMAKRYEDEPGTMISIYGEDVNIFEDWKKWTGYFKKFFETRKNFYSEKEESTAIAYRIVNQNLRRFCANIDIFNQIRDNIDIASVEKDLGVSCDEVFSLDYYNKCLLQKDIDAYNRVLGGDVGENDQKIQGINQKINEYRQKNPDKKVKFLAMLDKQIHGEKEKFIDQIENDQELFTHLKEFAEAADTKLYAIKRLVNHFAEHTAEYNLSKVYLSSEAFERNANRWFADYDSFESALIETGKHWKDAYKALGQSHPQEKGDKVHYPDFFICAHIAEALEALTHGVLQEKYHEIIDEFREKTISGAFWAILQHEMNQQFSRQDQEKGEFGYKVYRQEIQSIINQDPEDINSKTKAIIKDFADSALAIHRIAKYFAVEKKREWLAMFELDAQFYENSDFGYRTTFYNPSDDFSDAYTEIVQRYNRLRNYLTKKPYNTDKWVLSFENPSLAGGWDKNKEKNNSAIILRKDGRYYLGIMHHSYKNIFSDKFKDKLYGNDFEKMSYKQIADPSKDIHNLILNKDDTAKRATKWETKKKEWPSEIVRIKKGKTYAKENFNRDDFETFVEYMKRCAKNYWSDFNLSFRPTSEYENIKDFTDDISTQGYKISFEQGISQAYLQEKNESGELFIFEIHNKDWNLKDGKKKTGTKNLHTIYWEQLFNDENAKANFPFKLNGEAELFFRPKTPKDKLGEKLIDGKKRISHYRYAHDKILFHCPITLNRVSYSKTDREVNTDIRKMIAHTNNVNIIGIDRGEKHLAYYSVIDQNGKILDEGSFNELGETNGKTVHYAKILRKRAKDRESARQEWRDIEQIKDTKKGFVSQMVRKVADLAVEYNAIIVLEDLNMRFKETRSGIEESIYQQFEKQLIDKMSFLVNKKEKNPSTIGHPLKALQLASPVDSFKSMGKQTGIIFYTAAGYTSRTCPECGYRRNIRFRFTNKKQAADQLRSLDSFEYDQQKDAFILRYSLKKLLSKEQYKDSKAENKLYEDKKVKDIFTLSTKDMTRYRWIPNTSPRLRSVANTGGVESCEGALEEGRTKRGEVKRFHITEYLKSILAEEGIDINQNNLFTLISSDERSRPFFQKILFALFLLTETRQTISGTDTDYIHCPDCEFDSRKGFQGKEFNGDANGAYNIARKGFMVIEKIKQYAQDNDLAGMGWGELSISIKEWDKFTQK